MKDKPFDYNKATIISNDFAEPISNGLEAAADEYANSIAQFEEQRIYSKVDFIAGANWKEEQFENERLKHCDSLTKEEYEMESDFVIKHFEKNNRTPTFCDAIEYGYRKAIEDACDWIKQQQDMLEDCFSDAGDFADLLKKAMEAEK